MLKSLTDVADANINSLIKFSRRPSKTRAEWSNRLLRVQGPLAGISTVKLIVGLPIFMEGRLLLVGAAVLSGVSASAFQFPPGRGMSSSTPSNQSQVASAVRMVVMDSKHSDIDGLLEKGP